ncbi:MAG: hypothetical protein K2X34_11825 [Hyphomonadaceae bacterium]|nr:hypothetical protein [Hyphomonadaceae bacterium]
MVLALAIALASCQPVPVVTSTAHPAGEVSCSMLYDDFSTNANLAIQARANGDQGEALYRMMAADMNLDILIERDCCRFDTTCPAAVRF